MVRIMIHTDADVIYNDDLDWLPFVAYGNKDFVAFEELEWWKRAKEILREFCNYYSDDPYMLEILADYGATGEKAKQIIKIYDECRSSDAMETIVDVARVLYPEKEFCTATIRGYCQRDWQEVAYEKENENLLNYYNAVYFGQLNEIQVIDGSDEWWRQITDDELWELGDDKGKILAYLDLPADSKCEIYKADGVITTTKWKQIA